MDTKALRRSGGRLVGLVGGLIAAVTVSVRTARPAASVSESFRVRAAADIHSEYVKYLSGKDTITAYLAYPERRDPAPGVIVIHEIFGMSDFIRQTAEQLA